MGNELPESIYLNRVTDWSNIYTFNNIALSRLRQPALQALTSKRDPRRAYGVGFMAENGRNACEV